MAGGRRESLEVLGQPLECLRVAPEDFLIACGLGVIQHRIDHPDEPTGRADGRADLPRDVAAGFRQGYQLHRGVHEVQRGRQGPPRLLPDAPDRVHGREYPAAREDQGPYAFPEVAGVLGGVVEAVREPFHGHAERFGGLLEFQNLLPLHLIAVSRPENRVGFRLEHAREVPRDDRQRLLRRDLRFLPAEHLGEHVGVFGAAEILDGLL